MSLRSALSFRPFAAHAGSVNDAEETLFFTYDKQFNVTGVWTEDQEAVERYGYAGYGERTVLNADLTKKTVNASTVDQQRGHQGLLLDRESGAYYNRARQLLPGVGVFNGRDPRGYVDGANLYQSYRSAPHSWNDPQGTTTIAPKQWPPGRNWRNIRNFDEGLTHFLVDNGETGALSQELIDDFMQLTTFKILVGDIRRGIQNLSCDGPVGTEVEHTVSGSITNILTAPWTERQQSTLIDSNGVVTRGPVKGGLRNDIANWSFNLDTTIGSIHLLEWTARFTLVKNVIGCCTLKVAKVDFHLHDTYDFKGNNNSMLSWIPRKAFDIDNYWTIDLGT